MTEWRQITSDSLLDNVDTPFRVRAGPGAGKTSWLVLHIKNVLKQSMRLTGVSHIACISYTNVAAEEIVKRLGAAADRVEVLTIHSFLYRNIVKPYVRLLKNEDGTALVNYALVDGHDEHRPSYPLVKAWLGSIGQQWVLNNSKGQDELWRKLEKCRWLHNEGTGEWQLQLPANVKPRLQAKIATGLATYKAHYWKCGIIDHDDVLYFSHRILKENPTVVAFLSDRFPYLFVDEFQDTNPVQTQVVSWLAEYGTVVGVIGDPEQAIFGFQGARRKDFEQFGLPGCADLEIPGNHRSTNRIISLLNHVRRDGLEQCGQRSTEGEPVRMLVGTIEAVATKVKQFIGQDAPLAVLARDNKTVCCLRGHAKSVSPADPWEEVGSCDPDRRRFLEQVVRGAELARVGQYSQAITEVVKGIRIRNGELRDPLKYKGQVTILDRHAIALSVLEILLTGYDELAKKPLLCSYERLSELLRHETAGLSLKRVVSGQFKQVAERMLFSTLAESVILGEDARLVRTIHKAKATEFPNVLVYFESQEQLARVIEPDKVPNVEEEQEERRIAYVGLSRARDQLFMSTGSLDGKQEASLSNLGVGVIRC